MSVPPEGCGRPTLIVAVPFFLFFLQFAEGQARSRAGTRPRRCRSRRRRRRPSWGWSAGRSAGSPAGRRLRQPEGGALVDRRAVRRQAIVSVERRRCPGARPEQWVFVDLVAAGVEAALVEAVEVEAERRRAGSRSCLFPAAPVLPPLMIRVADADFTRRSAECRLSIRR